MQIIDNKDTVDFSTMYAPYIEMAKALSLISHQGVYLADVKQKKYVFISEDPLLKGVFDLNDIYTSGFEYLNTFVPCDDRKVLERGFGSILSQYKKIQPEHRDRFVVILSFRILLGNKTYKLYHKISPLVFDHEGMPRLVLGLASVSSHKENVSLLAGIVGTSQFYTFDTQSMEWKDFEPIIFSAQEKEMLSLSMSGMSIEEIAKIMNRSPEAIKKYRRQINDKLGVKNISEAVSYSINNWITYGSIVNDEL